MARIAKKVSSRLARELPPFQKVLAAARDRDVNESDTVTIVTDMLGGVFGFDKYTDITSEQAIRGTYCDLAVKLDGKVKYLIEVKAIGLDLKDNHLRQAINYGANHGIPWVILTNGINWEIHNIKFERPISHEHVCSINLLGINPKKNTDQTLLYLICKEGIGKGAISTYHEHVQGVNRYVVAALIRSEPVLATLRRELRRMSPGLKVTTDEIGEILADVLKRDVCEGDPAAEANKKVRKAQRSAKQPRTRKISTPV